MKKVFKYGDWVRVKLPGQRAFTGKYYSEYLSDGPGSERYICVEHRGGGVAYRVRYCTLAKKSKKKR